MIVAKVCKWCQSELRFDGALCAWVATGAPGQDYVYGADRCPGSGSPGHHSPVQVRPISRPGVTIR